jgi:hypothetical protein
MPIFDFSNATVFLLQVRGVILAYLGLANLVRENPVSHELNSLKRKLHTSVHNTQKIS